MAENNSNKPAGAEDTSRRNLLGMGLRAMGVLALGGSVGAVMLRGKQAEAKMVWQIDPNKCTQCGKCATECVLAQSAVRCQHSFGLCGYCDRCFGYFDLTRNEFTTAAENQICPTDALRRVHVEGEYYEYQVVSDLCIGCAKCVKGCGAYGNQSLFLQVDHKRCVDCNQCAIARVCPAEAFVRVPQSKPYLVKTTRAH